MLRKAILLNLMMPCFTRRSVAKNSSPDCFLNALVQVRSLSLLQKEKIGEYADFWWTREFKTRTRGRVNGRFALPFYFIYMLFCLLFHIYIVGKIVCYYHLRRGESLHKRQRSTLLPVGFQYKSNYRYPHFM